VFAQLVSACSDLVEAAEILKRSLIAAADELGVRTQRGQWWLPR
jgi:hypothetical protein